MARSKKYFEYKEKGLCARCGREALTGKTRCEECHQKHLEYGRRNKAKAVSNGLCRYCLVAPAVQMKSMCSRCLERHRAKARENSVQARILCIKNYGGRCVCCGEWRIKYLQLDHVNNDGAKHRLERGHGGNLYHWAIRNQYPRRLQLLCANCHQAKTFFGGCTAEDHPPLD